jgi:hypothetical protein
MERAAGFLAPPRPHAAPPVLERTAVLGLINARIGSLIASIDALAMEVGQISGAGDPDEIPLDELAAYYAAIGDEDDSMRRTREEHERDLQDTCDHDETARANDAFWRGAR